MEPMFDLGTLEVIAGVSVSTFTAVAVYFLKTMTHLSEQMGKVQTTLIAEIGAGDEVVERNIDRKLVEIWTTININDKAAQQHRADVLTAMQRIPTRDELQATETRIMQALDRAQRQGGA